MSYCPILKICSFSTQHDIRPCEVCNHFQSTREHDKIPQGKLVWETFCPLKNKLFLIWYAKHLSNIPFSPSSHCSVQTSLLKSMRVAYADHSSDSVCGSWKCQASSCGLDHRVLPNHLSETKHRFA